MYSNIAVTFCPFTFTAEEQAVLLAVEAKKRAWLAELKAHMEQDQEVPTVYVYRSMLNSYSVLWYTLRNTFLFYYFCVTA